MEIERTDVFDFKVVLTEKEFAQVVLLSEKIKVSIEQAFAEVCGMGITDLQGLLK